MPKAAARQNGGRSCGWSVSEQTYSALKGCGGVGVGSGSAAGSSRGLYAGGKGVCDSPPAGNGSGDARGGSGQRASPSPAKRLVDGDQVHADQAPAFGQGVLLLHQGALGIQERLVVDHALFVLQHGDFHGAGRGASALVERLHPLLLR